MHPLLLKRQKLLRIACKWCFRGWQMTEVEKRDTGKNGGWGRKTNGKRRDGWKMSSRVQELHKGETMKERELREKVRVIREEAEGELWTRGERRWNGREWCGRAERVTESRENERASEWWKEKLRESNAGERRGGEEMCWPADRQSVYSAHMPHSWCVRSRPFIPPLLTCQKYSITSTSPAFKTLLKSK